MIDRKQGLSTVFAMLRDRYAIRRNAIGRFSIIDIFTDEPVTIGRFHMINLDPGEAADMAEVLNDADRLKRRLSGMTDN